MSNQDPKKIYEFIKPEYLFVDDERFTQRKWGIISNGQNIEEALCQVIEKIAILNWGNFTNQIMVKQMTQIPPNRVSRFEPLDENLLKIALIEMTGRAQKATNKTAKNEGESKNV